MSKLFRVGLFLALTVGSQAQTLTNGMVNGRLWTSLSTGSSKSAFIFGFREGLKGAMEQLSACGPEKLQLAAHIFPSSSELTLEELVASVDRFYDDPLNRPISIARALMYIRAQVTGMKPAALADVLADFRKEAAAAAKQ